MVEKFSSDGEAYLAMRQLATDREEIWRWFYFKSKVWKAIYNHIATSEDVVIVSIPTHNSIATHRGTGHAISLRDFGVYGKNYDTSPPTEATAFWMKVSIGLVHISEDHDYGSEVDHGYNFNVPTELMFEFTEEKFNAWISDLRRKRDVIRTQKDDEALEKLISLYPDKARIILEKIKC